MNMPHRILTFVVAALFLTVALPASAQSQDEQEIRAVAVRQGETWNHHDAKAYAALFTENCDVVNILGAWWKSRAELERNLTPLFKTVFANSHLSITDVKVRFLSPEIALAHAYWRMSGAKMPRGIPAPRAGIQTLVFVKQGKIWLITGFQNTLDSPKKPVP